jgi:hypothetical protein
MPQSLQFNLSFSRECESLIDFVQSMQPSRIEILDSTNVPFRLVDLLLKLKVSQMRAYLDRTASSVSSRPYDPSSPMKMTAGARSPLNPAQSQDRIGWTVGERLPRVRNASSFPALRPRHLPLAFCPRAQSQRSSTPIQDGAELSGSSKRRQLVTSGLCQCDPARMSSGS